MAQPPSAKFVIASNRGPVAFSRDSSGNFTLRHSGGGLVTTLAPAIASSSATWFSSAIDEAPDDPTETNGFYSQQLAISEMQYRQYYDTISNGTLWFLHHGLFDSVRRPHFDRRWHEAWDSYRSVNSAYAS